MRVVKPALVNNRNQENEIKKVSSTPHLLIATEISELRPVLLRINSESRFHLQVFTLR